MENIVISKLENKNIKEAASLINALHSSMVEKRKDIFIPKQEDFQKYLNERIQDENWIAISATIEGKLVGVCLSEIKHLGDNIETNKRDILFIDYIAVNDEYKRNKVGTKLLNYMKEFAKKNNIKSIELNVWGFNESAIKFYETCEMTKKRIVYEYFIDKE